VNGVFPQWISTDATDAMDEIDENGHGDDFGDGEALDNEDYGLNKYSILGCHGMAIKAQMDAAESSVRGAGWLDESPDELNPVNTKLFEPDTMQTCSKWKAAVQDKRQQVLAERIKYIPSMNQQN